MTQREKDQDVYAILVVMGIEGLMLLAANDMYYAGFANSWVPIAVATVLAMAVLVYVRVRGTFSLRPAVRAGCWLPTAGYNSSLRSGIGP